MEAFTDSFAMNLGKGGMFIASRDPLPNGTHLHFEFFLANNAPVLSGTAIVRWTRVMGDPRGTPGMGVQFEALPDESRDRVQAMLRKRAARAAGNPPSGVSPVPTGPASATETGAVVPLKNTSVRRQPSAGWMPLVPQTDLPETGPIVGIDLGTSNTCVAHMTGARPVVLRSRDGYPTVPSVVALNTLGKLLVGRLAKEQRLLNPAQTVYGVKRLVGRSFESATVQAVKEHFPYEIVADEQGLAAVRLGDKVVTLEQLLGLILVEVKKNAEEQLGEPVHRAVITVPAYYTEVQRQAVRRAGALAGLRVERTLNEPTAAALAYGLNRELSRKVLVYDLGGGTFDATLMRVQNNSFEVMATGGDTFLGGLDFDQTLVDYMVGQFQLDEGVSLEGEDVALARIADAAETAKVTLSEKMQHEVLLPTLVVDENGKGHDLRYTLNRKDLEISCKHLVDRSLEVVKKVMADAHLQAADVDEVVLVGGQSRMPLVRERLRETFGKSPHAGVHPDEAVAQGAALLASTLSKASTISLVDVLPVPIGIALPGGKFQPVLGANTKLPARATVFVRNEEKDARTVEVHIFQGDDKKVAGNDYLGMVEIRGVPPGKKDEVKISLILKLDPECQLSVEARDPFGKELKTTLKLQHNANDLRERLQLTQADTDAAREERAAALGGRGGSFWGLLKRTVQGDE